MSQHSPIREDKTCLNCRHVVERRFCPNCGQENTDSRKTFHHLFVHFFEDLTHYENSFWKTIRHLLFKPGRLTQEYLSGKRMSYLAPVRLYIFISFVTFFLISVLPGGEEEHDTDTKKEKKELVKTTPSDEKIVKLNKDGKEIYALTKDSIMAELAKDTVAQKQAEEIQKGISSRGIGKYKNEREYDSIQATMLPTQRSTGIKKWLERTMARVNGKTDDKDFDKKFVEAFIHNVPKALFLYMPIFAFWLWVFHGKRRWYYFDHGIFTLHYFSFMLLTLSIMLTWNLLAETIDFWPVSALTAFLWFFLFCWWFFYFFRSHSRFYGESKAISRLKSLMLYFINMWLITFFTMGLLIYTILYLH